MILQCLEMFFLGFISSILIYLTGKIILGFFEFNTTSKFKAFCNYIIGLVVLILFYSCFKTNFKTINLGLIPILITLIIFFRKSIKRFTFDVSSLKGDILLLFLVFFPVFTFQSLFYFDFSNDTWLSLYIDQYWYADFSNSLKLYGVESTLTDLTHFFVSDGLFPYHYAELWLTSFLSSIYGVSAIASYALLVIPICVSIFLLGCYTLFESSKISPYLKYILVLLIALLSGVFFTGYESYELTKYAHHSDNGILSIYGQKHCIIYIYILLSAILFIKHKQEVSLVVLLVVPVFSIVFLPGIIGGVMLYGIYMFWIKGDRSLRLLYVISSALYIILFTLCFYVFFKPSYPNEISNNSIFLSRIINGSLSVLDIKIFIGNVLYRLARPIIFYVPYLPFLIIFIKKMKDLSVLYFFILFSGIITSALLFDQLDVIQFATNLYLLFNIIVIIALSISFEFTSTRVKFGLLTLYIAMIFLGLKNNTIKGKSNLSKAIDKSTFTQISSHFKGKISNVLVFLDEESFKKIPLSWWQLKNDLLPVIQCTNSDVIFSLGNPSLYFESSDKITYADSAFANHKLPISKNSSDLTIEEFIKENNIKYLYIKNGVSIPIALDKIGTCIKSESIQGSFYHLKD